MLRRDFISKIIEQMVDAIARLLRIDFEKEPEKFLTQFDELLDTYYQLEAENLHLLLEPNDERDAILLDEKLKNFQLKLFVNAGFSYLNNKKVVLAQNCLDIIMRIKNKHADVFEFPGNESKKLDEQIAQLEQFLKVKRN